jgi:hypothetical protein
MTTLDPAALDYILADLDLAGELEAAALCATDPDARHDDESVLAGRELLEVALPDVRFSTFGGFASPRQLAIVRSVVGEDWPIHEVGPDRVYVPELRAALRRWASAEQRRAVVLAS